MSIWDHAVVYVFSPFDTPLGWYALFVLAIARSALLGVGPRGRFSSHMVYTRPLAHLSSDHFFFTSCILSTLVIRLKLEYSAPF